MNKIVKRRDNKGRVLNMGESQDEEGRYRYKYTDALGKRKSIYSWKLVETDKVPLGKHNDMSLREKEKKIQSLLVQGISGSKMSVLELVERHTSLKTGVKPSTIKNYGFIKNVLKKEEFSSKHMDEVKISDAKLFFIKLQDDGRGYSTINAIRGVLRPAFNMAVDDDLILKNPFDFPLSSVIANDSEKRTALSQKDEERLLEFIIADCTYSKYYDVFLLLLKTGIRISEFCGLTVKDLDFED